MTQNLLAHLKNARTGIAVLGILTMLSLSACDSGKTTVDGLTGKPTDEPSISASATPKAADDIDSDTGITYPPPAKGQTTSAGEPAEKAEARYLEKATEATENEDINKSDKELLTMGYETCGHMLNAKDMADARGRIKAEINDGVTEDLMVALAGIASTTICPEFSKL